MVSTLMEETSLKNSSMYLSFSSLTGGGGGGEPVSMSPPPCDGLRGVSKPWRCAVPWVSWSTVELLTEKLKFMWPWQRMHRIDDSYSIASLLPSLDSTNHS